MVILYGEKDILLLTSFICRFLHL